MKQVPIGPDFLGIGPPKTGSTWIYGALKYHPDVDMPPMKEIGFFWQQHFLKADDYWKRYTSDHWWYKGQRGYFLRRLLYHGKNAVLFKFNLSDFGWDWRLGIHPYSDTRYLKLLSSNKLRGDITPRYCELPNDAVRKVHELVPSAKIIISLRDPVDREWSRAKMNLCKRTGRSIEEVSEKNWVDHFNQWNQTNNDYTALCDRWIGVYGSDNVYVMFFDDLKQNAWNLFCMLCDFINLDHPPESLKPLVAQPRGAGVGGKISPQFEEYLIDKYSGYMRQFANRYPQYTHAQRWVEKYNIA